MRRTELLTAFIGPLEIFYEERMQTYLLDIGNNQLLAKMMAARIELGGVKESNAMDEVFRQI